MDKELLKKILFSFIEDFAGYIGSLASILNDLDDGCENDVIEHLDWQAGELEYTYKCFEQMAKDLKTPPKPKKSLPKPKKSKK